MNQSDLVALSMGLLRITIILTNTMLAYNIVLSSEEINELQTILFTEMQTGEGDIQQLLNFYFDNKKKALSLI